MPSLYEPTVHQLDQLSIATSGNVGVLTGAAGTGKSFAVSHYLGGMSGDFAVAGPTGKSAARLRAEGLPAVTIHKLLNPLPPGDGLDSWSFEYNRSFKLPFRTIVIDEAPMISTTLMASLLEAVELGSRILFCGDPYQLPPVGHGRPVFDMINSGVIPHGHLSEVHRYAGRIAKVANAIKDGKPWKSSESINLACEFAENFKHFEVKIPALIMRTIGELIERIRDRGFHPIDEVQVICALNEKGSASRKDLNKFLQSNLNPDGESDEKVLFRVGDKIICNKNHARKIVVVDSVREDSFDLLSAKQIPKGIKTKLEVRDTEESTYLANGEVGKVYAFIRGKSSEKFPKGKVTSLLLKFSEGIVQVTPNDWGMFELAYAVTCHKFQGAQSPVVIVVADEGADRVASRQWWYTAVSRAGKLCLTIGKKGVILRQCQRVDLHSRKTLLKERIQLWGLDHSGISEEQLMSI